MNLKRGITLFKNFILNPDLRFSYMTKLGFHKSMSDERFVRKSFELRMGKKVNLENPVTLNDKLQWLKLHDRRPIYTIMADKYRAREYITEKIGSEYTVPLYGVWKNVDDIDFDSLPDSFVIKCNHDCGGLSICRDKNTFDVESAKKKLSRSMSRNYYTIGREWQYKNIKPVILAEKLLFNSDGSPLVEYDFFCFNGNVRMVSCAWGERDRGEVHYNDFYDEHFNRLDLNCYYPSSDVIHEKPVWFDQMKELAVKLAGDRAFLRVDIYVCDNRPYIGELTFHHWGGMGAYEPIEWNSTLGSWLDISGVTPTE